MDFNAALAEITETVFLSMLGFPIDLSAFAEAPATPSSLIGAVEIGGAFDGAVTIECSAAFARKAAAVMFSIAEAEVDSAEMADTLGELANMIAGNLKALVGGGCQLSLPTVALGAPPKLAMEGLCVKSALPFRSEGHPVRVQLLAG